ncbi:MAG: hypothetical protein JWR80_9519 [Bradyrhizobium sp.]|nr:hypothetical protein [Bradyrhizobium sp.]
MGNWFFHAAFSRAEVYGLILFVAALSKGADELLCFVMFVVWAVFANWQMQKRARWPAT